MPGVDQSQWNIPTQVLRPVLPESARDIETFERDVAWWQANEGPCGVPVSPSPTDDVREFLLGGSTSCEGFNDREQSFVLGAEALSEQLFRRGWRFSSADSSPSALVWAYPPSRYAQAEGHIEPVTTFHVFTFHAPVFEGCEFSLMVAGHTWEAGEWPVSSIAEFLANIDAVESHRAGDDIASLPFAYDGLLDNHASPVDRLGWGAK